jgi:hypothetical protein
MTTKVSLITIQPYLKALFKGLPVHIKFGADPKDQSELTFHNGAYYLLYQDLEARITREKAIDCLLRFQGAINKDQDERNDEIAWLKAATEEA